MRTRAHQRPSNTVFVTLFMRAYVDREFVPEIYIRTRHDAMHCRHEEWGNGDRRAKCVAFAYIIPENIVSIIQVAFFVRHKKLMATIRPAQQRTMRMRRERMYRGVHCSSMHKFMMFWYFLYHSFLWQLHLSRLLGVAENSFARRISYVQLSNPLRVKHLLKRVKHSYSADDFCWWRRDRERASTQWKCFHFVLCFLSHNWELWLSRKIVSTFSPVELGCGSSIDTDFHRIIVCLVRPPIRKIVVATFQFIISMWARND